VITTHTKYHEYPAKSICFIESGLTQFGEEYTHSRKYGCGGDMPAHHPYYQDFITQGLFFEFCGVLAPDNRW
jgi:hypothetical protein